MKMVPKHLGTPNSQKSVKYFQRNFYMVFIWINCSLKKSIGKSVIFPVLSPFHTSCSINDVLVKNQFNTLVESQQHEHIETSLDNYCVHCRPTYEEKREMGLLKKSKKMQGKKGKNRYMYLLSMWMLKLFPINSFIVQKLMRLFWLALKKEHTMYFALNIAVESL